MGFLFVLGLIGMAAGMFLLIRLQHNKDLEYWNKENKKKFETYHELKIHLKALEDKERSEVSRLRDYRRDYGKREQWNKEEEERRVKERARFRKELEDKIKEEDKIKRERKEDKIKREFKWEPHGMSSLKSTLKKVTKVGRSETSGNHLGTRLKKLRQMHKDGTLTKAEFEKAKNKLLK